MRKIRVSSAKYIGNFSLRIFFNDGSQKELNFGDYIRSHPHPQYNKYLIEENFINFSIEMGNVVWGENWDLIFPIEALYSGNLS
ncbi:MAG: DUF2442 domain-containing protein [bacterium]|nr:DUF2442 domain-containing protein [Candidatus Minthenecus merdequi]